MKLILIFLFTFIPYFVSRAGQAPGDMPFYWNNAELIVISRTTRPINEDELYRRHNANMRPIAKYLLQIDETIRGPQVNEITVINPSHHTSNDRWNAGIPGTLAIFIGNWNEEQGVWIVPYARSLDEPVLRAVRFKQQLEASESDDEVNRLLDQHFPTDNRTKMGFILGEIRRLERNDLLRQYLQDLFYGENKVIYVAEELFRLGDLQVIEVLKNMLGEPDVNPQTLNFKKAEIARILSRILKKEGTDILRPYLHSENEALSLDVATHLIKLENESEHWMHIFKLAQETDHSTIRHNASYRLNEFAKFIPIEDLIEIRDFVEKNEVSVAILNSLNIRIRREEKEQP